MLSRRHIRLKVLQSLYAYFSSEQEDVSSIEESMLNNIEEVVELNLGIISLIIQLVDYANIFFKENKKKHLPTQEDLDPKKRFVENKVVSLIKNNKELMSKIDVVSVIWTNNDHDIIRKLFNKLYQSSLYKIYVANINKDIDVDQKFFVNALNNYILNDDLVRHIFEERSIYWLDDLPFVATIIIGNIKSKADMNPASAFKEQSDKDFALELLHNTIRHNKDYEKIIIRFAKNWDLDRIAVMDQLFLKMAFAEIFTMKELPIKVSMNEYIEISKYYSTKKSKLFVNGVLDNVVKHFTSEGKIKKVGRGLA